MTDIEGRGRRCWWCDSARARLDWLYGPGIWVCHDKRGCLRRHPHPDPLTHRSRKILSDQNGPAR